MCHSVFLGTYSTAVGVVLRVKVGQAVSHAVDHGARLFPRHRVTTEILIQRPKWIISGHDEQL